MKRITRPIRLPARKGTRALLAVGLASLVLVGAALATSAQSAVAPANNSLPSISGAASVGSTLDANIGTWTGSTPLTYQYQWQRCDTTGANCAAISGATSQTYELQSADQGTTTRVQVIASNSAGSANATSSQTATVAAGTGLSETVLPTISGTTTVGDTLTATSGTWSGSGTISYAYQWMSCSSSGANCNAISGATSATYQLATSDAGTTLRVQVTASNAGGSSSATSSQTATVAAATTTTSTSSGCPAGGAGTQVTAASVAPPSRLQIAHVTSSGTISAQTQSFAVSFKVTDTCGQPVGGAQVYATAVPYNQFSIPPEGTTDPAGDVTLVFNRKSGFPAAKHQQLLVMFVRATRPGDPLLAGISTSRLVAIKVEL